MKPKKSLRFKIIISVIVLIVLLGGGAVAYSLIPRPVSADVEKSTSTLVFDFDASKAPDWFANDSIGWGGKKSDATAMRIFNLGTKEQPGECFVMYSYWADNSKDLAHTLNEMAAPASDGSLVPVLTNTVTHTTKSSGGDIPFQLNQYNLTGPAASQMSDGEEFAVFKAGTGYVEIRGYCRTVEELTVTTPVFSAVSFKL
jgi:hypothetical protein